MFVRLSVGHFDPTQFEEINRLLREGGPRLIPSIKQLQGCRHYYAGIDRASKSIVNVSVWDTREHAEQMASLQAMQDEGALMRSKGVRFDPIVNYETVWEITP